MSSRKAKMAHEHFGAKNKECSAHEGSTCICTSIENEIDKFEHREYC